MAKLKKALKKIGKAAAVAGAAYAASKMMSPKSRDSEVGAKLARKVSPKMGNYDEAGVSPMSYAGSTYDEAGMSPRKGIFGRTKDFLKKEVFTTNPKTKVNIFGSNPNAATYRITPSSVDDLLSTGVGGAKKGTFVTVKTKIGRNKKTRIC